MLSCCRQSRKPACCCVLLALLLASAVLFSLSSAQLAAANGGCRAFASNACRAGQQRALCTSPECRCRQSLPLSACCSIHCCLAQDCILFSATCEDCKMYEHDFCTASPAMSHLSATRGASTPPPAQAFPSYLVSRGITASSAALPSPLSALHCLIQRCRRRYQPKRASRAAVSSETPPLLPPSSSVQTRSERPSWHLAGSSATTSHSASSCLLLFASLQTQANLAIPHVRRGQRLRTLASSLNLS